MAVKLLLLLLGTVTFAAFSWAVKGHFRSTGTMPAGMKLTSALSLAGFLWFACRLALGPPAAAGWLALSLFAMALALFGWSLAATWHTPPTLAFADDPPAFLLRGGPYRYVRHPFYVSYLLFWTGTGLATPGLLPWLAPLTMLAVYSRAAGKEEQKFDRSDLRAAYAAYRAQVGRFVPKPPGWHPS